MCHSARKLELNPEAYLLNLYRLIRYLMQVKQIAPSSTVVCPRNPVELGDPNILICSVDRFSPPVLNITWLKNNEVVSQGMEETEFYPSLDNTFHKFSYLTFVLEQGDFYVCQITKKETGSPFLTVSLQCPEMHLPRLCFFSQLEGPATCLPMCSPGLLCPPQSTPLASKEQQRVEG
ncbi:HLA class II histocompatibility antigen, DP alpha 1 chain-like [Rhineura floridana]|uniref:HLA class II histocompatibility antigen, DP alpha 1 chain-like n=1 Tax=Rhineura floridana TaxID=261503 RepID=UPI002AC7F946|nr:HLA class II histocompatibility antigen, DP alpha 1 chain-like [Rhineura floridana]